MNIAAIVGDASMFHVDCAKTVYGARTIELVLAGYDMHDGENNPLGVVFEGSDDLRLEDGAPQSCGRCLGYIVPDERTTGNALVRDILNLSGEYREEEATRTLSMLARYVGDRMATGNIGVAHAEISQYWKSVRDVMGDDRITALAAGSVLRLIGEYRRGA